MRLRIFPHATFSVAAAVTAVALIVWPQAAGAGSITVTKPVNVTHDQFADNEESLGMDPSGTLLAGSWNDFDFNDGCGFSYSTDGGSTWAPRTFVPGFTQFTNDPGVPGTGSFEVAGDPAVAYNPAFGTFDVVCQTFDTSSPFPIQLQGTTFDPAKANPGANENDSYGAAAWTHPVAIATGTSNGTQKGSNGQFPDHESIMVDTSSAPGHHFGRIYVTWAKFNGSGKSPIQVAFSDDNGKTWTGPITVSDSGHQFDQDGRINIGPDGTVYDTWINSPNETSTKNNQAMVAKSTDGGLTWSASATVAPVVDPIVGGLPNSLYRDSSDVTSAVDQATGQLVVAYTDKVSGASNVWVTHALSGGSITSWSTPRRVKASAQEQFFPWMSAAPNGRVDLVYYDRSCDSADTLNCVTLSSTFDGGAAWTNTALTTKGFDGDKFQACLAFVDPPNCGVFFLGDYIAVNSINSKAQVLFTGNGPAAMDVFSLQAAFSS
jgi:Neuraminidase (sialidase)